MSAWGKIPKTPIETINFAEIMSEENAHRSAQKNKKKLAATTKKKLSEIEAHLFEVNLDVVPQAVETENTITITDKNGDVWEDYTSLLTETPEAIPIAINNEMLMQQENDEIIARILQSNIDYEFNSNVKRFEKQMNKSSKVTVTMDNFLRKGAYLDKVQNGKTVEDDDEDADYDDDEESSMKRDWDRFETNEKLLNAIPKCGFKIDQEGEFITKHDPQLCGVRNACRVMSLPPEFDTGDTAGFDVKLSNQVYNKLKIYSQRYIEKHVRMQNRKGNKETAEIVLDSQSRLILLKLIDSHIVEEINGIIATGKEAVILYAGADPSWIMNNNIGKKKIGLLCPTDALPKQCAIKIFKTTLNEFKQRDLYIKDDYRFKGRFNKQNNTVIKLWAEKEMYNLKRMKEFGINCPQVVMLKKHILVMSFIGDDNRNAALKLKHAKLNTTELNCAYKEIIQAMHTLYNKAKLVHADLSEYNILWYENKCWLIDVAQSVEPEHPSALEYLMRDCTNIINFFKKRGLTNIYTKEELFEYITSLNAEIYNVSMLERIHTRGTTVKEATAPNQERCPDEFKPLVFPFDLAWEASQKKKAILNKQKKPDTVENTENIDKTSAEALKIISINYDTIKNEQPIEIINN